MAQHVVPNRARYVDVRPAVQRGSAIVRIEEIDAKSGHGESCRLAARWGTSDDKHPGRHLPAEIAIRAFPHILRQVLADALTFAIGDTQALQFFCCGFYALAGRLQVGINFRFLPL